MSELLRARFKQQSPGAWLCCVAACLTLSLTAHAQTAQPAPNPLKMLNRSLEKLAEDIAPAVVEIFATGFGPTENPAQPDMELLTTRRNSGSGVIVHPEGFIITTAHLVKGAQRVRVLMTLASEGKRTGGSIVRPVGRVMDAKVLGYDLETDLAVLKIEAKVFRYLKFGDSSQLKKGQLVFALGNPRRMEEGISMGLVSSPARQLDLDDPMIYIQTDAGINPGNSGGPLVDIDGNVIGINNYRASQEAGEAGFGLAAPGDIVGAVYEQIRETGHVRRGIIGITAQTINPVMAKCLDLPQDWGVVVADVIPTSPADLAGVRVRDIILSLDGKVMENARQFNVNVYQRRIGDKVRLEILRNGASITIQTAVFESPDLANRMARLMDEARTQVPELGVLAADIDGKTMGVLPFFRGSDGVLIAALTPGSLSWEALKPGDLIHSVDNVEVRSLSELKAELEKRSKGDLVYLHLERKMQFRYALVELQ